MMASRFVATFRDDVLAWNKKLNAVADVVQLMAEIQRSWACETLQGGTRVQGPDSPRGTGRAALLCGTVPCATPGLAPTFGSTPWPAPGSPLPSPFRPGVAVHPV